VVQAHASEVRRVRVGDVPVAVEDTQGGTVEGLLDEVRDEQIRIDLGHIVIGIAPENIAAFTLLPGPPIDTSDQAGR
jgi:hypothetical protein